MVHRAVFGGESKSNLAREFGVSRQHVYRVIKEDTTDMETKYREAHKEMRYRAKLLSELTGVPVE